MGILKGYPKLAVVTERLDSFLREKHPEFFGKDARRPFLELKPQKVIHDSIWGTFSFLWRELAILDTPLIQKLRDIHQIGLAYQVYPSARHSRLEHSLGVLVMASRIFDSLAVKHRGQVRDAVKAVFGETDDGQVTKRVEQLRQELRIAALLHDAGHSLHSHASERVFSKLKVLTEAVEELSDFAGKRKGAGEVLSFCFTLTPCLGEWLRRADSKLRKDTGTGVSAGPLDMENVALMIVGRSKHPFLQFLGDIISSDIDADKLDYLLRDSVFAGLPLRYDVDMYLYSAQLDPDVIEDGEGALEKLYNALGAAQPERRAPTDPSKCSFYDAYRLCLPKRAMHVLEQIVICKMMLFTYVYHHPKVRAAEGLLEKMLGRRVKRMKERGRTEWEILEWFLQASDADLRAAAGDIEDTRLNEIAYRLVNRLLPREIFRLSASETTGPQKALLSKFLKDVRDKDKGPSLVRRLEEQIGEELRKREAFKHLDWEEAMVEAGMWLDVPKAPKFEETQKVVSNIGGGGDQASAMFPVHAWQHAYTNYRSYARIYAYSQHVEVAKECAKEAMKRGLSIEDDGFYRKAERERF
jgi:HD superfamily phosphohydrolase